LQILRIQSTISNLKFCRRETAMLKNRWIMAAGILGSLVCAGFLVLALLPARPAVTQANFDRIKEGMTQVEVEAIFGGPAKYKSSNGRDWSMLREG
jgi:hypothetical protein